MHCRQCLEDVSMCTVTKGDSICVSEYDDIESEKSVDFYYDTILEDDSSIDKIMIVVTTY